MLYRFTHALAEMYGFVAFGCFVALFLIAFAFTVLYPIVPIVLIMLAPFAAVVAVGGSRLLRVIEQYLARRKLGAGDCPYCGGKCEPHEQVDTESDDERPVPALSCTHCNRAYIGSGPGSGRLLRAAVQSSSSSVDCVD